MSRITAAAATSHTLSVTAMEEASRLGQHKVDIDHMLLALVVSEQVAGQVLRSFGVTLDAAREAVDTQHAEQLASLGIRTEMPTPGRITFHETGISEWSPRAQEVIKSSAEGKNSGDAAAVLRELLDESSGLIEAILHRLGTTPQAEAARLDEAVRHPVRPQHTSEPSTLSGVSEGFAPAPMERVWELLADPTRMPEWEPGTGHVENPPTRIAAGSTWTAHALTRRPDGKPIRVRPAYRTARIEVTAFAELRFIEWCFTWPDAPKSNARRVRIELEPAAGGTHLRIFTMWVRDPARVRSWLAPLRWLLRPVHRFAIWIQLAQLSGAISRAFR